MRAPVEEDLVSGIYDATDLEVLSTEGVASGVFVRPAVKPYEMRGAVH